MKKNNIKKFLLATSLSAMLIAAAGFGTHSWFTSETNAHGKMQSGVLEINDGMDIEESLCDGQAFTPAQLEYGNWVSLSNTGDLDAHLKATYSHSIDKASLDAYEVGYIAMKYNVKRDQEALDAAKIELDNLFDGVTNERSPMSISGDAEIYGEIFSEDEVDSGEIIFGDGSEDSFWELDEGQYIDIMIGVKLDESAGNDY